MQPFVDTDWLAAHRHEVVLVDIRFYLDGRPGRPAYEAAHIADAVYVELEDVLTGPHTNDSGGRHPLPSPERFAEGLAAAGIGDGDTVVAYDDAGGVIAARLAWMLRAIGQPAAVLDGGLAGVPSSLHVAGPGTPRPPAQFTVRPWPEELLVDIDEVAAAADGGSAVLIDARGRERFEGAPDPLDPRFGHIPGARSVPVRDHLTEHGRIASADALRATFSAAGIEPGTPVISYCGSGITACHNLLALEHAGLGPARLFAGSWSQWSRDPSRPVATGGD